MIKYFLLFSFFILSLFNVQGQTSLQVSNDTTICLGGSATLSATVTSGSYGTSSYTFQTYAYSPEPFSGGSSVCDLFIDSPPAQTHCTSTAGGKDDCWAGPIDIGFDFCFFNQTYTQFYVGSNGWISFSPPPGPPANSWDTFTSQSIPNTGASVPKNVIFFPWEDWLPCKGLSNVNYYNSGTSPNMKLVVYFNGTTFFDCNGSKNASFEVVLNQQSSIIENHIQSKPQCGSDNATQGVQNIDGTVAFIATGRNNTQWTATNESTRFVPSGIVWYTGGYPGGTIVGYGTPFTVAPTVTTTYTAEVTECDQTVATGNVTVTVVNPQFNYAQPSYCQSDIDPTPTVLNPTGTFSAVPAGLVFLSTSTGAIDLSASAPGTYTITYLIMAPCNVAANQTLTINATPAPPTPLASYVSHCGPGQVTFGVVQPAGVTIHWYDAPVGGNLLPFAGATVTTNVLATTHYYAEAVTTATTCKSLSRADIIVVIKSVPVITNTTLNYNLCSGDSLNITLVSSLPNSTFQWVATSNNGTLSGYSSGSGLKIAQKLVNSGALYDTVVYSTVATKDTCTSNSVNFTVVVKPVFLATANPLSQSVCSSNLVTINLTSNNPTTIFTWTATGNYPPLSGYSNGTGNPITQTLSNAGPGNGTVTYTITPNGSGCIGPPVVATVQVLPLPSPVISGVDTVCVGSSSVVYTTQTGMNNYLWNVSAGGTITAGGTPASNTVTVTWNIPGSQSVSVNYNDLNGCTAASPTTYPVIVNPLPGVAGAISGPAILCQEATGVVYSIISVPNAKTYLWTLTPGTAGTITGNSKSCSIDWAAPFFGTATLNVTPVNDCGVGITSPSFPILINPKPTVSITLCVDSVTVPTAKVIQLRLGIPLGGIWSGAGVNSGAGTFSPAIAGIGAHTITYSYPNVNGCINTDSKVITVINPGIFSCGNPLTDIRDNKTYNTVQIGSQCWIAENLNYGTLIGGIQDQRDNCIVEKYCLSDNPANCVSYGGLYQWDEMMAYTPVSGSQGICPPAWHIPTEAEWNLLFSNYVNNGFAANALKSTGYSGFNAFIAGVNFFNVKYDFTGFAEFYWSSDSHGINKAWAHGMNFYDPSVSYYPSVRSNAFSLRCIKD
jgi:uncharacterized protein (TIGR02145 family)